MITVDAQGKNCPIPLIMTKRALEGLPDNETLEIIIDNETSHNNVTRFLKDHGIHVVSEQQGKIYRLFVNKTGVIPEKTRPEEYCSSQPVAEAGYVIAIQKQSLGGGDDDLGELLMKGFINTLPDLDRKPEQLVFLNSGISLTLKDSPVLDALRRLQDGGTKILVCGTCLDFYDKKQELAAGIVSNMYDILEVLSNSGKVLYP